MMQDGIYENSIKLVFMFKSISDSPVALHTICCAVSLMLVTMNGSRFPPHGVWQSESFRLGGSYYNFPYSLHQFFPLLAAHGSVQWR